MEDTQQCSWLRHCTSWKVTGSIPNGPGVDPASNRNEYQEYFLRGIGGWCIGPTTLPPSGADCLENWEPQPPGTLRDCPGMYRDCLIFALPQEL